jgi:hypothetical protein
VRYGSHIEPSPGVCLPTTRADRHRTSGLNVIEPSHFGLPRVPSNAARKRLAHLRYGSGKPGLDPRTTQGQFESSPTTDVGVLDAGPCVPTREGPQVFRRRNVTGRVQQHDQARMVRPARGSPTGPRRRSVEETSSADRQPTRMPIPRGTREHVPVGGRLARRYHPLADVDHLFEDRARTATGTRGSGRAVSATYQRASSMPGTILITAVRPWRIHSQNAWSCQRGRASIGRQAHSGRELPARNSRAMMEP